ncbi:hypothetical protein KBX53_18080 [Micromonospora sp. M51]|uniref:Uncharacterized protein n=1 Tax=Micromonospora parva TaxID=1464048 RepID=A0ABW6VMW1_9ACTN|nr:MULTISPECIES: hypothetical protein [Micromonospora]MBQ1012832.1 hypothetical protein [Micromonospora sp. M51]MBQ1030460.1 hypothetical protein [Micromonospora sp. C97]
MPAILTVERTGGPPPRATVDEFAGGQDRVRNYPALTPGRPTGERTAPAPAARA